MGILRAHIKSEDQILGIWDIEESVEALMEMVNRAEIPIHDIREYRSELKQRQWLATRLLLRDMNPTIHRITYDELGAPHIQEPYYLSLSHSARRVAVLLDSSADIGIDIQEYSAKILRIKEKFCSESELEFAKKADEILKLHLIWCAKEAIYKKMKDPGVIFSTDIAIEEFSVEKTGRLKSSVKSKDKRVNQDLRYEIIDDYTLVYTVNT